MTAQLSAGSNRLNEQNPRRVADAFAAKADRLGHQVNKKPGWLQLPDLKYSLSNRGIHKDGLIK
jgi:hypothetical protein